MVWAGVAARMRQRIEQDVSGSPPAWPGKDFLTVRRDQPGTPENNPRGQRPLFAWPGHWRKKLSEPVQHGVIPIPSHNVPNEIDEFFRLARRRRTE